jgi:hypothetical protein
MGINAFFDSGSVCITFNKLPYPAGRIFVHEVLIAVGQKQSILNLE